LQNYKALFLSGQIINVFIIRLKNVFLHPVFEI